MATYDLVIRNGMLADGTGRDLYEADAAIKGGVISVVGNVTASGTEEIDARGKLVAPGFVDAHTHYDGQVTWSNVLDPTSDNGVTTAIMGNCGVGFAPCRPQDHDRLVRLMEGVEDIPEPVLSAGLPWEWESFPDYMDWLSRRQFNVDVGAQLPHAALRVFVMGERGARREPATAADAAAMAKLAGEAMKAGALGFTTSRTLAHRTSDGDFTPTLKAGEDELLTITRAMREAGHGVLQFVLDLNTIDADLPMLLRVGESTGAPINLTVTENDKAPAGAGRSPKSRPPRAEGSRSMPRSPCVPSASSSGWSSRATRSWGTRAIAPSWTCRWPSAWPACATPRHAPESWPKARSAPTIR
jgi:N-acyl-D-aspartate/D-glutamate deacylase